MKVTVIIVNWNTGKLLQECLESLKRLAEKDLLAEVVVVDNHSSDNSFTLAKSVEIGVPTMMMTLPENIGFAAANNMALRQRRNKDTHVLLLNPDTQVISGAIATALREIEGSQKVGIVGVKLLESSGTIQPSVRAFPTMPVLVMYFLKLQRLFPKSSTIQSYLLPEFDYNQRQSVNQVMGAFFLINHALLQKIGLLDANFWVWFEEVDYCKRAKNAGFEVIYTPAGSILHHGGVSFHQLIGFRKTVPFLNSALRYANKHLGVAAYVLLITLWPIGVLFSLPASLQHTLIKTKNKTRL